MSEKATPLRSQVEQVFHLTNELQVRLQVLESARVPIEVRIIPRDLGEADVEALAFIVMMEAAKSAQEDLKAILAHARAINKQKEGWRATGDMIRVAGHPPPGQECALDFEGIFHLMATLYAKQLAAEGDALLGKLDSMSEMGELESLRLQMAMDRMSKAMSALSNLLKKISDTSSQIVQNLK